MLNKTNQEEFKNKDFVHFPKKVLTKIFINPQQSTITGEVIQEKPNVQKRIIAILHEDYIEELVTPIQMPCSTFIKTK